MLSQKFGNVDFVLVSENEKYEWIVYVENSEILGYAYIGPYRSREAYKFTVETSLYIKYGHQRKGISKQIINIFL